MLRYEEQTFVERLTPLSQTSRAMFAAACAERLMPLYVRFHEVSGQGDPAQLNAALGVAWSAVGGQVSHEALFAAQTVAEHLTPDEDDDEWVEESAYAQNGAIAVAYALEVAVTGQPQTAAWAARQVYDAADYAARQQLPDLDLNESGAEGQFLAAPIVQEALAGLREDLIAVQARNQPLEMVDDIREGAHRGGQRLAGLA